MAERRGPVTLTRRARRALWSCAAFFALGYFPTMMMPVRQAAPVPTTMPASGPATAPASAPATEPATMPHAFPPAPPRRNPMLSMVLVALAIVPFGATAAGVRGGIFRGLGLGLIAGVAISVALVQHVRDRQYIAQVPPIYIAATAGMCTVIAALFAHMAAKRRRLIEQEWAE